MGFIYQMQQFQEERLWAAAAGLMKMERMIRMTIEYTAGRQAFGKSILDNQVVHFRLADWRPRSSCCARWSIAPSRNISAARRDAARLDGEAHRRAASARGER